MIKRVKKVSYKKKFSILDTIQYIIGAIIAIGFGIGLIPNFYGEVFQYIAGLIIVQILISIIRFRLLNVILELIILGLSVISLIPILGYFFRFLGILMSIIEIASFKSYKMYRHIEVRTFKNKKNYNQNNNSENKTLSKKYSQNNIKEAEYKEKN